MSREPYTWDAQADLLSDLNEAQRAAVTHDGSPLLVVAGAGSGKTRVLTRRVAWLASQGVPPWAILAITFTNKAARVMRERLAVLAGAEEVWAGTFHSFGAWLLRRHGDEIDIDPRFSILDRDDQHRLIKSVVQDVAPERKNIRPAALASMISHIKNGAGGTPPLDLDREGLRGAFELIASRYHERLRAASLVDFDDLLLESLRLLAEVPEVAAIYQSRFQHVLVDEYQDTNVVQRDLLLALLGEQDTSSASATSHAPERSLITVVGDPDQSIYRWRGATIRNILDFDQDFPGAKQVVLEQNYRSTKSILDCAEAVIDKNTERHAKTLFTENADGAPVTLVRARGGEHEGALIAERIARWIDSGRRADEVAVFYRVNSASRAIELALRGSGLPYVVVAGIAYFQRREIKDLLAYARLVANPDDDVAFQRIVNLPRRGVGNKSLDKIRAAAVERGMSIARASRDPALVSGRAKSGLVRFHEFMDDMRTRPTAQVAPLLAALVDTSGYRAMVEGHPDEVERARIENVDELLAFARTFDDDEPDAGLIGFLERTALVSDQDATEDDGGRVQMMSVHAAKGLEFPCVFVAGVEDGWFPHARSVDERGGTEEERRLFYVAMTRAQEQLVLSLADARQTYRGPERRHPSMFLSDLPRDRIEIDDQVGWGNPFARDAVRESVAAGYGAQQGSRSDSPSPRGGEGWGARAAQDAVHGDIAREVGLDYGVGDRVRHPYFGPGDVLSFQGAGADMRVTVEFDTHGRKPLMIRHAKLERMS